MTRHVFVVQTECTPGSEETFHTWYDEVHVPDVLKVPGFVRAQRFSTVGGLRGEMPERRFLALYEFEADDPAVAMAELRKAMRTMYIDPSLDMEKIVAFGYAPLGPAVDAAP